MVTGPAIPRRGILFVVSAPSGAGKTTLCNHLRTTPDFVYSVSCTTRAPRPGEIEGDDYYFLTKEDFERRLAAGEFLEHATVHGHSYGTLRASVLNHLNQGVDVLLDIDIQRSSMRWPMFSSCPRASMSSIAASSSAPRRRRSRSGFACKMPRRR